MIVTIHGKNLKINETMKNAIEDSLLRLERFNKFIKPDTRAKVEIRSYPDKSYKITVSINLAFHKHLQCEIRDYELFVAIKQLVNPLTQQLNHLKTQFENKNTISSSEAILDEKEEITSEYTIEELDDSEALDETYDDYDNKF